VKRISGKGHDALNKTEDIAKATKENPEKFKLKWYFL
jgi:hypothetical protein